MSTVLTVIWVIITIIFILAVGFIIGFLSGLNFSKVSKDKKIKKEMQGHYGNPTGGK